MGELAMRAVDLAPLVVQRHDLGHLVVEETVHRAAARRPVGQFAGRSALHPAVGAYLAQLELAARPPHTPAGVDRVGDEVEQPCFGDLVDAAGDRATQPQRSFPSTSIT